VEERTLSHLFVRNGRLLSGWRIGLYLVCYLVGLLMIQTPLVGLYIGYLVSQGIASTSDLLAEVRPDHLPIWLSLALKLAELILLLALTYLFCRLLDRRSLIGLGFRLDRGWIPDLLLGLVLGGVQMGLIFGIESASGWLSVGLLNGAALARGLGEGLIAAGLFVLVAVGEELMFRGYLQVNLREGLGLSPAIVLTSLIFGLFHALNPNFRWMALINLVLAGLSYSYGRAVTGNLWLPIAYHFSWNFHQGAVFALPVSGMRYGGLLAVADQGAVPLLTGAAFGPEGGLVGTLVVLLSFPVFWLWGRWRRVALVKNRRPLM